MQPDEVGELLAPYSYEVRQLALELHDRFAGRRFAACAASHYPRDMAAAARQSAMRRQLSWPFVGRDEELAWIAAARRDDASPGVVLSGAAGVGKTRLAREALAAAADDGAATEWVQATRAAASIPLGAFAAVIPPGVRADDRLQLFQVCADALRERARAQQVVLGVDDAHLLDPTSAALVLHLAASGASFVVVTVRTGERCPDSIVALWKDLDAPRLELQHLSEDDTARLLEAVLDGGVAASIRRWAYEASEGHVLYLRELVNGALADGALVSEEGSWRLRGRPRVSVALVELISLGLEGLSEEELDTARLLALGEPLGLDTLAQISGLEPLAALEERGLAVVSAGTRPVVAREARLGHPLYGDVVRAEMPTLRGVELRRSLAETVRASGLTRPGDALKVVTWLDEAGDPPDEQLLLAAARDANTAGDPQLAERLARRARPGPEQALVLGTSCAMQGRYAEAEEVLAEVEEVVPCLGRELALDYLDWRASEILDVGLHRWDDAFALTDRAANWFPSPEWRARVEGLRIAMLVVPRRAEALAAAERLLQQDDLPPDVRRRVSILRARMLHFEGRNAEAYALSEGIRPSLGSLGRFDKVDVYALAAWCLVREAGGYDWDELEAWLAEAERAIKRIEPSLHGWILYRLASAALWRGRPATALRWAHKSIEQLEHVDPGGYMPIPQLWAAIGAAMQRDTDTARAALQGYEASLEGGPNPALWRYEATARAMLLTAEGESSRAVATLFEAAEPHDDYPLDQVFLLHQAFRAGAPPETVSPAIEQAAARCDAPLPAALARLVTAAAAHDGPALTESAQTLGEIGAWLWAAEGAALAAEAFTQAGREDSARRAMALSRRFLDECEDVWSPVLATVDLAPVELSRREQEIVALAARGASNAAIAERLVLSVRTVESHLYRAMRKLGVDTRAELRAP